MFSIFSGQVYQNLRTSEVAESSQEHFHKEVELEEFHVLSIWKQQFVDALRVKYLTMAAES